MKISHFDSIYVPFGKRIVNKKLDVGDDQIETVECEVAPRENDVPSHLMKELGAEILWRSLFESGC